MSSTKRAFRTLQWVAMVCVIVLFILDYALDVMAKTPPWWAYAILGLLALGVEAPALRRLVVQAVKVAARIPLEEKDQEDE